MNCAPSAGKSPFISDGRVGRYINKFVTFFKLLVGTLINDFLNFFKLFVKGNVNTLITLP